MRASRLCAALSLVAGGACGQAEPTAQPAPTTSSPETTPPTTAPVTGTPVPIDTMSGPPAILVRGGGNELVLRAWSSCWHSPGVGSCGDGRPPENPRSIGSPPEVEVAFDAPGWQFRASAVPTGKSCGGREQSMDLVATGPTTHRLRPIGKADDYTITVRGRSTEAAPNKGDVVTTFRWRTTANGPSQPPSATLSLLATPAEAKVSLGAELSARALGVSTPPGKVRATAVVTAGNGAAMDLQFAPHPSLACVPDGSLFWRSDGEDGRRLTALGPAPYEYSVTLVLHGVVYRGTGTWPQDEIHDCSPCTRLEFVPPLPSL